ncbi:MAG TPA: VWA domain-containing protein [Bryobacteraceae bacterium]|nr:VWA domain-containing protein [Bryobacteraceae bacterium]
MRVLPAIALFAAAAGAQTSPAQNQPEVSSEETPITFSSRVNLVSVPVVVRDRNGRAVGNLRKEDFQLFDKGKPQVITKFTVEQTEAREAESPGLSAGKTAAGTVIPAPSKPALPDRYVAYLVDDVHLTPADLLYMRKAMKQHLDGALRASDRAAIFTTAGVVVTDFTSDREKLDKGLDSIKPWTNGADSICPGITYFMADVLVNRSIGPHDNPDDTYGVKPDAIKAAGQCGAVTQSPSDKAPHATPQVIALWDQIEQMGKRESQFALGATEDVIRRLSAMPGNRTLVMVSGGFIIGPALRVAEQDAFEKAVRTNIAVNTIDARGVWTYGDDISIQGSSMAHYKIDEADEKADSLAELASNTGGKFFHDDNDLRDGFNQVASRPEFLYVLGFSPQDLKSDGSYHALKVTVAKVSRATIQARRGYWAPQKALNEAEEAKEDIADAVFSRDEISEIPVDLQTRYFKPSDEKAELTVVARIKAEGLRFRRANDRNNDQVTVVSAVYDSNGNFIKGIQRVITLRLRDQSLASLESAGIVVKEDFNVAPGRYVVRLVVRDSEGRTMAAQNGGIEIP